MNELLKVINLEKYYGNDRGNITKAIDDISLEISKGEFVGVMGASGSGKTTLLNSIATIDMPSAGHIILDNMDITELSEKSLSEFRGKHLGFVFQDFNLLDTLTIYENITLALILKKIPEKIICEKVINISKRLGIDNILDKYPYEVSGGQKQRCACARAIVKNPKLILADEPTGALDSKSAQMLLDTFLVMNTELSSTILMVTHDAFSASYCSRILFLKDGRIFNQIVKGQKTRRQFFNEILDVMSLLGGGLADVR